MVARVIGLTDTSAPKNIYFYYNKIHIHALGQSSLTIFNSILITPSLMVTLEEFVLWPQFASTRVSMFPQRENGQWLFFGRNIGQLTPKIIYFHYLRKCFLDQSIQKIVYLILKKEALSCTHSELGSVCIRAACAPLGLDI